MYTCIQVYECIYLFIYICTCTCMYKYISVHTRYNLSFVSHCMCSTYHGVLSIFPLSLTCGGLWALQAKTIHGSSSAIRGSALSQVGMANVE